MDILRNNFDLNLIRVFNALMQESSVKGAAQRIGISASAVSHALSRMRTLMKDDLFVRTSVGMQPTAKALAMSDNMHEALLKIENAIDAYQFDPSTSARCFTVAANDYLTAVLLPTISRQMRMLAPATELVVRPSTRIDLAEQIDLGHIDIALATFSDIPRRYRSDILFSETDVLVISAAHPLAQQTIKERHIVQYPIVGVSLGGKRDGAFRGYVSERGLVRRSEMFDGNSFSDQFRSTGTKFKFATILAHYLALPEFLADSDNIAIVPTQLGEYFSERHGFLMRPIPFATAVFETRAVWHERGDNDAALGWLRSLVFAAAKTLPS